MSSKYKVLVVTDDKQIEKKIGDFLDYNVYTAKFCDNIKQGSILLETFVPDILLINYELEGKTSLDFCKEIKLHNNREINSAHIIGMSSKDDKNIESEMLNNGAQDFMKIPFSEKDFLAKINVGKRISEKIKLSKHEFEKMFEELDVLLIQDGGCAPGYNPVTAFLTNRLEDLGRQVYCTREGFKSLVNGTSDDIIRLIYNHSRFKQYEHINNVFNVSLLTDARGAQFRSERFPEFKNVERQKQAVEFLMGKKVKAIVAIGGNGTFYGIRDLQKLLPQTVQLFFVPVTIDSDVYGTETIGEHTGVEVGAEKIRCYLADARTHKRIYIVEMMGADGGFHALHSCIGARAHLAVLPNQEVDFKKVVKALNEKSSAVIVVAEGYKKKERKEEKIKFNAAEYFHKKLVETGIALNLKVVCEPFSRDIRGAAPNNLDITLAQRMAYSVATHLNEGNTRIMPAIKSTSEGVIPFSEIKTENEVSRAILKIANRLYT